MAHKWRKAETTSRTVQISTLWRSVMSRPNYSGLAPFWCQKLNRRGYHGPASTRVKTVQEERLRPRATGHCLQEHSAPPTNFRGFSRPYCRFRTLRFGKRIPSSFSLVARFLHALRPVCWHLCALLHAPSTPHLPWSTEHTTLSPARRKAHTPALMLQLSLGEFFFFFTFANCTLGR